MKIFQINGCNILQKYRGKNMHVGLTCKRQIHVYKINIWANKVRNPDRKPKHKQNVWRFIYETHLLSKDDIMYLINKNKNTQAHFPSNTQLWQDMGIFCQITVIFGNHIEAVFLEYDFAKNLSNLPQIRMLIAASASDLLGK